jgi:hypothetical protein
MSPKLQSMSDRTIHSARERSRQMDDYHRGFNVTHDIHGGNEGTGSGDGVNRTEESNDSFYYP